MRYVPSKETSRIPGVHPQTLGTWTCDERISYIRTGGKQRRFDIDFYIGNVMPTLTVCYCRVSSKKQSAGLGVRAPFSPERDLSLADATRMLRWRCLPVSWQASEHDRCKGRTPRWPSPALPRFRTEKYATRANDATRPSSVLVGIALLLLTPIRQLCDHGRRAFPSISHMPGANGC